MKTSLKERFLKLPRSKKMQLITALVLSATLVIAAPIVAWFTYNRQIALTTKINAPTQIYITAGNEESVVNLDLSDIDVEETDSSGNLVTKKDFVMGIAGTDVENYMLQLAHTTNIPFTYTLYWADNGNENDYDVEYTDENGGTHYYKKSEQVTGNYLNMSNDNRTADNSKHNATYDSYDNVQPYAEPLYWQSNQLSVKTKSSNKFCDYFIIEVSWNSGVSNQKETDMVYLTVKSV